MFVEPLAIKKALLQIWQSLEDRQFFQGNVFTNGGLTSIDNKSSYPHGVVPTPQNPWNLVINTYDHTSSSTTQPKKNKMHSTFHILIASTSAFVPSKQHHHREPKVPDRWSSRCAKDHFKPWPLKIFQLHGPMGSRGQGHGEPFRQLIFTAGCDCK